MKKLTYEQLRMTIKQKGYELKCSTKTPSDLPVWSGTTHVSLTPEQAKSILKHNASLTKLRQQNATKIDYFISTNESDKFDNNIKLQSNYHIYFGTHVLEQIAKGVIPVDVVISIKEENKFGFDDENKTICKLIIDSIKDILIENGKTFPDIDMSIFEKELPKKLLPELVIDLNNDELKMKENLEYIPNDPITIVVIMSTDRSDPYPDKLYILKGKSQTGEADYYACTMLPLELDNDNALVIKPGIYEDLFFPDNSNSDGAISLIQHKPVQLYYPLISNEKIVGFNESPFSFMKVSIPVLEMENSAAGIIPTGIKFNTTNTEDMFITDINIDYNNDAITLVVLEDTIFL